MSDLNMLWGEPRERAMPLVPEPFSNVSRSRQSVFAHSTPLSKTWATFCPNIDIPEYRKALSETKKTELDRRATKLMRQARQEEDPDATIGLKSYDEFFLKRGYICSVPDCEEDHDNMQPDERLSEDKLQAMMRNPNCGLVANDYEHAESQVFHACMTYLAMLDDLVRNPDSVTEYQTRESSKYQLFAFVSCGAYWQVFVAWNMLGACTVETIWEGNVMEWSRAYDLICIVDQIHHYATHHHRAFVMKHLEAWYSRHEKTLLLPGDDELPNDAAAVERPADGPAAPEIAQDGRGRASSSDTDASSDERETDSREPRAATAKHHHPGLLSRAEPEWLRLKELSRQVRQNRAYETRLRNRTRRVAARPVPPQTAHACGIARSQSAESEERLDGGGGGGGSSSSSSISLLNKRPRGRPRKVRSNEQGSLSSGGSSSNSISLLPAKRPRGRPRKMQPDKDGNDSLSSDGIISLVLPAKRPRGRPRKVRPNDKAGGSSSVPLLPAKRPRGRPRKVRLDEDAQDDLSCDGIVSLLPAKRPRGRPPKAKDSEPETLPRVGHPTFTEALAAAFVSAP
ncbi:hypothetical protein PWT90_06792 [Aphanocladium album]|nr:hypothetical protein PWT90_06792 [Aphanocladium album]